MCECSEGSRHPPPPPKNKHELLKGSDLLTTTITIHLDRYVTFELFDGKIKCGGDSWIRDADKNQIHNKLLENDGNMTDTYNPLRA